jgi:hypothetical protein
MEGWAMESETLISTSFEDVSEDFWGLLQEIIPKHKNPISTLKFMMLVLSKNKKLLGSIFFVFLKNQ